jgi:hypothetical protein
MATDIRRMSSEELDEMNRQIAIYKNRALSTDSAGPTSVDIVDPPAEQKTEQLDLWGDRNP